VTGKPPKLPKYDSLSKIDIENFKSIEKTSLSLAPLTVLIGVNSRGKSTILQSILVVAQSIGKTKFGEVSLNGEAVSLGTSDEVFHKSKNGRSRLRASIGIEVSFAAQETGGPFQHLVGSRVSEHFLFNRRLARSRKGLVAAGELKQTVINGQQVILFERSKLDPGQSQRLGRSVFKISKSKSRISVGNHLRGRDTLSKIAQAVYLIEPEEGRGRGSFFPDRAYLLDTLQLFEWSLEPSFVKSGRRVKPSADGRMENQKTLDSQELERELAAMAESFYEFLIDRSATSQVQVGEDINYLPRLESIRPLWGSQDKNDLYWPVIEHLQTPEGKQQLRDFASNVEFMKVRFLAASFSDFDETKFSWSSYLSRQTMYLGPLREKDAVSTVGKLDFSDLTPLGPKAEFLADFVFEKQSEEIDFPTPSSVESQKQTYIEALEAWACGYFQLGSKVSVSEEGRSGPVLRVNGNRLQHLGTGVSQILPVIALCLWAKPGSTIILEQPELHLHPGLQQKLGTFLTVVASTGRQVIVETHSEYLLTRIRRHIAEGHLPEDSCTLVFVQDDGSVVQRPALTGGDLEEWPEQFLDHSLDDALAIASLREDDFLDG
jgi:predicted ATPase